MVVSLCTNTEFDNFVVSRFFFREMLAHFPELQFNQAYRAFIYYLFFGVNCDNNSGNLLLCRDKLRKLTKGDGRFKNEKFLQQFQQHVLQEKTIKWSKWRWKKPKGKFGRGHCRQLIYLDLGEFNAILEGEWQNKWRDSGAFFLSGEPVTGRKQKQNRHRRKGKAYSRKADSEDAQKIRRYLNELPPHRFTKIVNKNYPEAYRYAFTLPPRKVQREIRLLRYIASNPQPFYSATLNGNTSRLFTSSGIPDLKSEVRKVLTCDWAEADLSSSQLSICATLWRVQSVVYFLQQGQKWWSYLFDGLEIPIEIIPNRARRGIKSEFKEATYSICFGMDRKDIRNLLARDLTHWNFKPEIADRFMRLPLVADLLHGRDRALREVEAAGEAVTCYDKVLRVAEKLEPRQVAANLAQAWEMKLIMPAFDVAETTSDFRIMIFQHDGFSVHFWRNEDRWRRRIKEAVDARALELGFPTVLEWQPPFRLEA